MLLEDQEYRQKLKQHTGAESFLIDLIFIPIFA